MVFWPPQPPCPSHSLLLSLHTFPSICCLWCHGVTDNSRNCSHHNLLALNIRLQQTSCTMLVQVWYGITAAAPTTTWGSASASRLKKVAAGAQPAVVTFWHTLSTLILRLGTSISLHSVTGLVTHSCPLTSSTSVLHSVLW